MTETPRLSYCADYVRRNDKDRFLCSLFARPDKRESLFTLYAFNQEVSKTREMVSETTLGHIRLQWWRDTLAEIEQGKIRKHEVVEPLSVLIQSARLDACDLEVLIAAREFDLADKPPTNQGELDHYIDQTSGHLAVMATELLGDDDAEAKHAARLAGNAYGLVGILRAMVFHGRAKRLYLPHDRMEHYGVGQGDIFEFRKTDSVKALTREIAELAQDRIREARKFRKYLPSNALAAALPVVLADGYLRKLEKAGFDPFSAEFGLARPASFRLTIKALLHRY